jgi:hypothetical protein
MHCDDDDVRVKAWRRVVRVSAAHLGQRREKRCRLAWLCHGQQEGRRVPK